jgi:hypothetical protein
MTTGVSELDRQLRYLRETLNHIMNSELVSNATESLRIFNDPEFQQKLKGALDGITSLGRVADFANMLLEYKAFRGAIAFLPFANIGTFLFTALNLTMDKNGNPELTRILENMELQTRLQMAQVRSMANIEFQLNQLIRLQPNYAQLPQSIKEHLDAIEAESQAITNKIPPLNLDTLEYLKERAIKLDKVFKELYEKDKKRPLDIVLDDVTAIEKIDDDTWDNLIIKTIYQTNTEINYNLKELSYRAIKCNNGGSKLDELMKLLAKLFDDHGGYYLYYRLGPFVAGNFASENLMKIVQKIPTSEIDEEKFQELNNEDLHKGDNARKLLNFYHSSDGAKAILEKEWQKFIKLNCNLIDFNDKEKDIIILRSFLEYCKNTAHYLSFPHNIGREFANGGTRIFDNISALFSSKKKAPEAVISQGATEDSPFIGKECRYI